MDVAILLHETEQVKLSTMLLFYFSSVELLMVGPSKHTYEVVRQTDGERFFAGCAHVEFAKDSLGVVGAFATLRTQNRSRECE